MEKFGLDVLLTGTPIALEVEIAREKAAALGLTGTKLQDSLSRYRVAVQRGVSVAIRERLMSEVSDNIYAILVQRELLGFVHENVSWVVRTYEIPEEILSKLGLRHAA